MEENKNEEIKEEVLNEQSQIENNNVEENKKCKSNKPFVIIIVIIAMALTFGCGIMLGKKLFESKKTNKDIKKETEVVDNNQTESTNKDQNKEEIDNNVDDEKTNYELLGVHDFDDGEIDINNQEVNEYFNMYKYIHLDDDIILNSLDQDSSKLQLAARMIKSSDFIKVACNSISSNIVDEENSYCGEIYSKSKWTKSTNLTDAIKKEIVEKYYKYYFGQDKSISSKSFGIGSLNNPTRYIYDSNLDCYVEINFDGGGTGPGLIEKLEKVEKNGDKLILKSKLTSDDIGYDADVVLTLKWEEVTNHYIFESRTLNNKQ